MSVDHAEKKIKMCQHRNRAVARMALKKDPPGFLVETDLECCRKLTSGSWDS